MTETECHPHRQAGFTLIELLIAMAISAILAVLAYQAVNEVTQVKTRLDASNERFSALQRALWWMEQDFSQMTPRPVLDQLGSVLPSYRMQGQQVSFTRIATYPSPYGESGLVRVGYQLEGEVLYRLVWPVLDRAPDTQVQKWELLDGVTAFQIRQMDEKRQWQTYWPPLRQETNGEQPPKLPGLVEIVLDYEGVGEVRRLIRGADS